MKIDFGTKHKGPLTYDIGWLYCACLYENGYSDWRLPNDDDDDYGNEAVWWNNEPHSPNEKWGVLPVRTI